MRFACVVLLGALLAPVLALATELISNANNPRGWTFDIASGAAGAIKEEEGGLRIDVTRVNGQAWGIQAYQGGKRVKEGSQYMIRFKAKASTNRKLLINCQIDHAPWRSVLASMPTANLTTQWQTFSFPLVFKDVRSETTAVPQFMVGDAVGTIWLKDISVNDGAATRFNSVRPPTTEPSTNAKGPATAPVESPAEVLLDPLVPSCWRFESHDPAASTLASDGGMLRIDVTKAGTERWHAQMYQISESLSPGTYTCSITVRSTNARKLSFMVEHNGEPWEKFIPYTEFAISPEWKEYKIRFTLSKVSPGETRAPLIQFGDSAGTIYIRAMSLMRETR